MRTINFTFLALFFLVFSVSCIGPRGYDGIDGHDGRDGISDIGVVIYDIRPSDWNGNIDGFTASLNVPEITEDIIYNGAVLVYRLRNEGTKDMSFNQLPYTWLNNYNTEYMDFDAYVGRIDITLRWVDEFVNNTQAPKEKQSYKILVIEGTPLSVIEGKTDISNPENVIEFMNNRIIF